MKREEILEYIETRGYKDVILLDGFDDAFLGIVERCAFTPAACYDRQKCIDILTEQFDGDEEGAVEFFEFNTAGGYLGETSPLFLERPIV